MGTADLDLLPHKVKIAQIYSNHFSRKFSVKSSANGVYCYLQHDSKFMIFLHCVL